MRVKIKDPSIIVYCPEQEKVVTGKRAMEVKCTGVIRDALREGLLVEIQLTPSEEKAREAKAKKEAADKAEKAEKLAAEKLAAEKLAAEKLATGK